MAEVIVAALARVVGLAVPEVVLIDVASALGRAEPDPEIQELIAASEGLNFGIDYLPGSLTFDPAAPPAPEPELAAAVVWLDAFVLNVDRTPRNPNLLVWHEQLYLIDHGAALYVHHAEGGLAADAGRPFAAIADHVLLPFAGPIAEADERLAPLLEGAPIEAAVGLVPDDWLGRAGASATAYVEFLQRRLAARQVWRRGGRACPSPLTRRSSTRCCASCRGSSAASRSTRASSSSRARASSWARA